MIRTLDPELRTSSKPRQSIGCLLRRLADESRILLKQEVELAKAELTEKAAVLARNAAYLAAGALVAYAGLLTLVGAACLGAITLLNITLGVEMQIALWLGPLIVGVIVSLIGYAFIQKAISTFKNESLTPRKTIDSMRENKEWLKEQMTTSNEMKAINR